MNRTKSTADAFRGVTNPAFVSGEPTDPPLVRNRWSALFSGLRRPTATELPLTLAAIAALFNGERSTALTIVLLALLTRTIAEKKISKGRRSLSQLLQAKPRTSGLAVEQCLNIPASLREAADWPLRFLVCLGLTAALFVLLTSHNVKSVIAVLVVGGAGGLIWSTSLALLGATARAAACGAFFRSTASLEILQRLTLSS